MAASFELVQDTGAATGSPAKGTTRTAGVTNGNFKNADGTGAYTSNPIIAGNNSYTVYLFAHFSGSFNQILDVVWAHTAGTPGTGLTLLGGVTSTYATPTTTEDESLEDISTPVEIAEGETVLLHPDGPESADPAATLEEEGYSQYLVTQLLTTEEADSGDTTQFTFTISYSEN